jgi:hypothetical protein
MGGPVREPPSHTVHEPTNIKLQIPSNATGPLRLRVTEVETLGLDAGADLLVGTPFLGTIDELRDDVVFADVLSLPDPP